MDKLIFILFVGVVGFGVWSVARPIMNLNACYDKINSRYGELEVTKAQRGLSLNEACDQTYAHVTTLSECVAEATASALPIGSEAASAIAGDYVRLTRPQLRSLSAYKNEHNTMCGAYDYYLIP